MPCWGRRLLSRPMRTHVLKRPLAVAPPASWPNRLSVPAPPLSRPPNPLQAHCWLALTYPSKVPGHALGHAPTTVHTLAVVLTQPQGSYSHLLGEQRKASLFRFRIGGCGGGTGSRRASAPTGSAGRSQLVKPPF